MPEKSIAQGAICTKCGKQNIIGTKFCQDCGEKLPAAVEAERIASAKDQEVISLWNENLSQYPVWSCCGYEFSIEVGEGYALFNAVFDTHDEAVVALEKYREVLRSNGFREEGSYASLDNLYKNINGEWYNVDTSHLFEGDNNVLDIYFMKKEPYKD